MAQAQQAPARPLIGVLSPLSAVTGSQNLWAFRAGLRDFGHVEGRDIMIELRFAEGMPERLPALAAELLALKPAVIVAGGPQAAVAVRNITKVVPVVMNSSENPIALGLAASLPRPGGNITGIWWGDEGMIGKQLELLKEQCPALRGWGSRSTRPTGTPLNL